MADADENEQLVPKEPSIGKGTRTLTEGDLEYKILELREAKFDCCFQFNLYIIAIIAGLLQGYQIGIIAGTELLIGDEFTGLEVGEYHEEKPNTQEREFFVSFFALGAAIGALLAGQMADWLGRKWMTVVGDAIIGVGFIIVILSDGIFGGFFGRFTSGIGQGVTSFTIPLYLNEVGTAKYNKIVAAFFTLFTGTGMIVGLNVAEILRHQWKILYQIGIVPVLLIAIFQIILPESQAHYINQGRDNEALEVLKRGLDDEEAEWELKKMKYERRFFHSKNVGYWKKCEDLFTTYLKPFMLAIILAAFNQFVGTSAFLYYGPEVIEMAQFDVSDAFGDVEKEKSADILDNFIIGAFVLGNLISAFLIFKTGRRWIVLIALPVACASAFVMSYTMFEANYGDADEPDEQVKQDYRHLDRMIFLGFLICYMLAISVGLSTTIWGISSEILPSYLLAQACSMIATFGWLINFAVNSVFLNILDDDTGKWMLFIVLGVMALLAWLFVFFFIPETIGKSVRDNLEQIIGKEALNRKRAHMRRVYGIKDVDVEAKSEVVKGDVEANREQYKLQNQY